jgi:hypothetical protein
MLLITERDGNNSERQHLGRPADTYFFARPVVYAAGEIRILDDSRPRTYMLAVTDIWTTN